MKYLDNGKIKIKFTKVEFSEGYQNLNVFKKPNIFLDDEKINKNNKKKS